jgi:hypothetical protein
MPKTLAAQAVQVSAFPYAYAKWESLATSTVDAILSAPDRPRPAPAPAPTPTGDCAAPKPGPVKTACSAPHDLSAYSNGRIPLDKLCPIPWQKNLYLRSDADAALIDLNKAYRAAFGRDICITDAYRTYDEQVRLKREKGRLAATPGTSNHGWARALDLCGGIQRRLHPTARVDAEERTLDRVEQPAVGPPGRVRPVRALALGVPDVSAGPATTVLDHAAWGRLPGYPSGVLVTLTPAQQQAVDAVRAAQQRAGRRQPRRPERTQEAQRGAPRAQGAIVSMSSSSPWADFEGALGTDGATGRPVLDRDTIRKVIGNT